MILKIFLDRDSISCADRYPHRATYALEDMLSEANFEKMILANYGLVKIMHFLLLDSQVSVLGIGVRN